MSTLSLNKLLSRADFAENETSVIFTGIRLDERLFRFLQSIDEKIKTLELGFLQIIDQYGEDILLDDVWQPFFLGRVCRLSFQKKVGCNIIISEHYFNQFFQSAKEVNSDYCIVFNNEIFETDGAIFWSRNAILNNKHNQLDNIRLQTEYNIHSIALNDEAFNFLPINYSQWVAKNTNAPAFWSKIASCKLLCLISTEVLLREEELQVSFRGDRRVTILTNVLHNNLAASYPSLCCIAKWIYQENREVEIRHSIFNNQVCFASISDTNSLLENLSYLGPVFLENSKLAYKYYLVDNNKDFIKSLTDLNKTLFEHMSKIRQNTVDLVNNLWRDFTTAFGLLIINFSLKKPDISAHFWDILLVGLVVYLIVSFSLNSSIGFWFYSKLKDSLIDIRTRLYAYLPEDDFQKFALAPLRKSQNKFRSTVWWIAGAYGSIIAFVLNMIKFENLKFW